MIRRIFLATTLSCLTAAADAADRSELLDPDQRIVFLGDSITHAGHYISRLEAQLRSTHPGAVPTLINLGLPSETCSGLSEPDHPFPRPDVHERLDRVLARARPDIVFACYGMNDGIYYPLGEQRFAAYKKGVLLLIAKVQASGAKCVLMSPPAFDPLPLRKKDGLRPAGSESFAWFAIYEDYDDVLARYTAWLMTLEDRVDLVIDLHTPVKQHLQAMRNKDPDFTMSSDGVHLNDEGHRILAATILQALGIEPIALDPERLGLVTQRQLLLHDAWLSHVGHLRPGVAAGLPLKEAESQAAELDRRIRALD